MKWLRHEFRDCGEFYLAIMLLIVAVVGAVLSAGCGYEPLDARGHPHRPWREDPYSATGADWFDRHIYTAEEAEAKSVWKLTHEPKDWVDAVRR